MWIGCQAFKCLQAWSKAHCASIVQDQVSLAALMVELSLLKDSLGDRPFAYVQTVHVLQENIGEKADQVWSQASRVIADLSRQDLHKPTS